MKISHKGLILVSVPLIFEIAFVCVLGTLLNQAEQERARDAHARDVVTKTDVVIRNVLGLFVGIGGYEMTKTPAFENQYNPAIEKLPGEIDDLIASLKDDPAKEGSARRIKQMWKEGIPIVDDCRISFENGNTIKAIAMLPKLKRMAAETTDLLNKIAADERKVEEESPERQAQLRAQVTNLLAAGMAFNVLVTFMLAAYFSKEITSRLSILSQNATRFAVGKPLRGPLEGGDELADLDNSFRQMVEALTRSSKNQQDLADRLSAVLDNMPSGVIVVDELGSIKLTNPALRKMFAYTTDTALIGQPFGKLLGTAPGAPDDLVGKKHNVEAKRWDEQTVPIELLCLRYEAPEGKRYVLLLQDLSDQQEIERLKQEFLTILSHELRSPLTSLKLLLDLIASGAYGDLSEHGLSKVNIANRNITRLVKMIHELLDMETIRSGKLIMQFSDVSISGVVEKSIAAVHGALEDKQITIDNKCEAISVWADEDRLVQVVVNLLANAIKFSPADSTVRIQSKTVDDMLELKVTDNGPGISPEYHTMIFERYKQVGDGTGKKGGVGLGLALSKAIIENLGGSIGVESELEKGSTFWFRIPIKNEAAGTVAESSSAAAV